MLFKLCLCGLLSLVFGNDPNGSRNNVPCNGGAGECVPYYLCDNGTINTDGSNLLTIRFGEVPECLDFFEECCNTRHVLTKPVIPPNINSPQVNPNYVVPGNTNGGDESNGDSITQCGFRNAEGVGNTDGESQNGKFPWIVAILKEELEAEPTLNVYQCGGSLITLSVVLTAAHCVSGKSPSALTVRAGEWGTNNELLPHTEHAVQDLVVNNEYNKGALHNDVALLFLKTPVKHEQNINTVCLPPEDTNFDHSRCFASGWGKDVFGKRVAILKKIELPVVPFSIRQNKLRETHLGERFILHNSFICAGGEPGKDTCKGDGGLPLVCPAIGKPGHYYQAGIVTWGIGCGKEGTPGVYVNVAYFRSWIDQQVTSHGFQTIAYQI